MTALIIIVCVCLLLALLLLCPVTIRTEFKDEFSAKIMYLFFHYTIAPRPQKNEVTQENGEEQTKQKKTKFQDIIKQKGLSGFLNLIREIARIASGTGKRLLKHLVISRFIINISVAYGDAAKTAVNYGYVCSVVYPAAGAVLGNVKYKKYSVNVSPDFQKKESSVQFSLKARIKLIFAVSSALYAFIQYIKFKKDEKNIGK